MSKVAFCFPGQGSLRGRAWAGRSPRPCPRRWRSIELGTEATGHRSRAPLLRGAARGARRDRGAAADARRDEPRDPRRASQSEGHRAATSSSATRSASSRRSRPSARCGTGEAIGLVRERGLAMAEAARQRPGRDGRDPRARGRAGRDALPEDPRRLAGELQLPGPDRRLGRERRGRGVLRRGREPRRATSDQAEGVGGVPQPARRAGGRRASSRRSTGSSSPTRSRRSCRP